MAFAPWVSFTPSIKGMPVVSNDLGNWLLRHRKARHLTQEELRDRSGVKQSYISKIENGEAQNVSAEQIRKLALAMDLPHKDLVEGLVYASGLSLDEVAMIAADHREQLPSGRFIGLFTEDGKPITLDDDTKKLFDLQAELLKNRPKSS